jgi:outer membrane protein TolC
MNTKYAWKTRVAVYRALGNINSPQSLPRKSISRSKDRFSSGVTDSVDVVQAEQSLSSADGQSITSLYNHNLAKLSLARALGVARTGYNQYLGGQ